MVTWSLVVFHLFLGNLFAIEAQARLFSGSCRKRPVPVVKEFNFRRYLGTWYEIEWYDDEYPTSDECISVTYVEAGQGVSGFELKTKNAKQGFHQNQFSGKAILSYPQAHPIPGQLNITFSPSGATKVNHHVLATDYQSFAFVWDCFTVNATHFNGKLLDLNYNFSLPALMGTGCLTECHLCKLRIGINHLGNYFLNFNRALN